MIPYIFFWMYAELNHFWVAGSHLVYYKSVQQWQGQGCSQNNSEEEGLIPSNLIVYVHVLHVLLCVSLCSVHSS